MDISWRNEEWGIEELKKAVEVTTAMAFWLAANPEGTPIPSWVILSLPIDKEEILYCWIDWNISKS